MSCHTNLFFGFLFDFLGQCDNVASVGAVHKLGNVQGFKRANGHEGWADADISELPSKFNVYKGVIKSFLGGM